MRGCASRDRFGTQFQKNQEAPMPIEDEAGVDARRKAVGLDTMAAYTAQLQRDYQTKK